jgi:hypothetical protein
MITDLLSCDFCMNDCKFIVKMSHCAIGYFGSDESQKALCKGGVRPFAKR